MWEKWIVAWRKQNKNVSLLLIFQSKRYSMKRGKKEDYNIYTVVIIIIADDLKKTRYFLAEFYVKKKAASYLNKFVFWGFIEKCFFFLILAFLTFKRKCNSMKRKTKQYVFFFHFGCKTKWLLEIVKKKTNKIKSKIDPRPEVRFQQKFLEHIIVLYKISEIKKKIQKKFLRKIVVHLGEQTFHPPKFGNLSQKNVYQLYVWE